jgi:hypothetical protein
MFPVIPARGTAATLEQVLSHLRSHEAVDGLVLLGSTRDSETLAPASDYDILVVLLHMLAPLHVALTVIGGRLADLLFVAAAAVERLLDQVRSQRLASSWDRRLVRWLAAGQIVFDRSGQLGRAQERIRAGDVQVEVPAGDIYDAWFSVNYSLRQTKRLVASDDPVALLAIDLRLLYCLADVYVAYFNARGIPYSGEKAMIRYLQAHDPAYLDLLQRCIGATERREKVALYEQLATHALSPLGGLWSEGSTAVQLDPPSADQDVLTTALRFCDGLLRA